MGEMDQLTLPEASDMGSDVAKLGPVREKSQEWVLIFEEKRVGKKRGDQGRQEEKNMVNGEKRDKRGLNEYKQIAGQYALTLYLSL